MKILITESQYQTLMEGKYIDFPVEKDVRLEVWEDDNKLVLDTIIIPKHLRGQGMGSKIMEMICKYADEVNKPLCLTPSASYGASSSDRLVKFYKRFGFKRNKDHELTMHFLVRYPNNI